MLTAKEHLARTYAQNSPTKSITTIDHKVFEGIMTGKRQSMSGFRFDEAGVFLPMMRMQSTGSRESLTSVGKDKEKQLSKSPALFRKKKRNVAQSVSTFRTYVEEDRKSTEGRLAMRNLFLCNVLITNNINNTLLHNLSFIHSEFQGDLVATPPHLSATALPLTQHLTSATFHMCTSFYLTHPC